MFELNEVHRLFSETTLSEKFTLIDIKTLEQASANITFILIIEDKIKKTAEQFFLKIYKNLSDRAVANCEPWIRDILPPAVPVPKVLAKGEYNGHNYLITEFIKGETLLSTVQTKSMDNALLASLAQQVITFVNHCAYRNTDGFGSFDSIRKKGLHNNCNHFLQSNINNAKRMYQSIIIENDLIKNKMNVYFQALNDFLSDNSYYFNHIESKLVPLDLNLNNFMVTSENKIMATDLESFAGGDPLLAWGELYGHIYHSFFGEFFQSKYEQFNENEQKMIHFYALLSNLNVFCFCLFHSDPNPEALTPWGNPNTFVHLMDIHLNKMNSFECSATMSFK